VYHARHCLGSSTQCVGSARQVAAPLPALWPDMCALDVWRRIVLRALGFRCESLS